MDFKLFKTSKEMFAENSPYVHSYYYKRPKTVYFRYYYTYWPKVSPMNKSKKRKMKGIKKEIRG